MSKTISALLKKTIIALLCAAFVAAVLAPTIAATTPATPKRHHKARHAHKAKPGNRSQSTLERGVGTSEHKTRKFVKKTFTAPHKTPPANGQ